MEMAAATSILNPTYSVLIIRSCRIGYSSFRPQPAPPGERRPNPPARRSTSLRRLDSADGAGASSCMAALGSPLKIKRREHAAKILSARLRCHRNQRHQPTDSFPIPGVSACVWYVVRDEGNWLPADYLPVASSQSNQSRHYHRAPSGVLATVKWTR